MMGSVNQIIAFINENELVPTTPMYNVTVKEAMTPADVDSMIVDIYIGVTAKQQEDVS